MKKVLIVALIIVFMLIFSSVCMASYIVVSPQKVVVNGTEKSFEVYNIDGNNFFKLRDIAYVLNKTTSHFSVDFNQEKNIIEVQKNKDYVSVGGELSIGEDKSKTAVKSSQKLMIDNVEKSITAYNIGGNNFFKLRELGTELDFIVDYDDAKNNVIINSKEENKIANITDVVAKIFNGITYVEITTDSPVDTYNTFALSDPNRIILDISNSNLKVDSKEIAVNYAGLTDVRLGSQGNSINRIVLDVEKSSDYKVVQSNDKKTTCIALSKNFVYNDLITSLDKVLLVYNGDTVPISGAQIDNDAKSGDKNETPVISGPTQEDLNNRIKITGIKYSSITNKLKINGEREFEYDISKLENPYRLIVDIKDAVLSVEGPTSISVKQKNISEIRFSQKDDMTVRVVFDLKNEAEYSEYRNGKTLEISVKESVSGSLEYKAGSASATLTLFNVEKGDFSTSESSRNNTYTLKFSTSDFAPKADTIVADDGFIEDIVISSGKIVINGNGKTTFSIRQDENNVVIKMKGTTKKSDSDFIVLLDAGHGGNDVGAVNGDDYEKTYNLAILLKVKELLEDNGYTVYATREKDVTLTVNDRVELATVDYPEASLYVSIHNNSVANDKYTGTLVMYCDRDTSDYGITNKELATYVLNELVSNLGTVNRGFIKVATDDTSKRVLTELEMPSILCEVAFVSNDEELARLKTERFQELAAEAIYNGILEAKEQMGL